MENVPQLLLHGVFERFLEALDGYHVTWSTVDCERIGVPQTRKRMVLMASRLGPARLDLLDADMPPVTVRSQIDALPRLAAGQADPSDRLHIACKPQRPQPCAASAPRSRAGRGETGPRDLRAACHRKATGGTYPSVYGRMEWGKPAPTMTTQCFGYGNGRFGHPEQDRAITLREAAILQTFPRDLRLPGRGRGAVPSTGSAG